MPLERDAYEALGARFELSQMPVALGTVLMSTGHIAPLHLDPQQRAGLWRNCGTTPYPDDFRDDCSLVARLPRCSVVITGCATPGWSTSCARPKRSCQTGRRKCSSGTAPRGASAEEVAQIALQIAGMGVCTILPCHCTGDRATEVLSERFPGKVVPIGTGSVIRVHEHGDTEVRYPGGPDRR